MVTSQDLHWAAGFMDGEGYFGNPKRRRTPRVNAVQKDAWPLLKLQAMFGGKMYRRATDGRRPERLYWIWEIYGRRAASVMMTLYVLLSPRRQERIRAALDEWKRQMTVEQWRHAKRGERKGSLHYRDKTHCKRGHEFTEENTYAKDGKYRQCRTCQRVAALRWYHAHKV